MILKKNVHQIFLRCTCPGCGVESWFPNQPAYIRAIFNPVPHLLWLSNNIFVHISETRWSFSIQCMLVETACWGPGGPLNIAKGLWILPHSRGHSLAVECPLEASGYSKWQSPGHTILAVIFSFLIDNLAHTLPNLRHYTLVSWSFAYSPKK